MTAENSQAKCTAMPVDEARELAALYVLEVLGREEAEKFAAHQSSGCAFCAAEVALNEELATELGQATASFAPVPSSRMREKLLSAVAGTPQDLEEDTQRPSSTSKKSGDLPDGFSIVRGAEGEFVQTKVEGVFAKTLSYDKARRIATVLVRMEPGASYPTHHHDGVEECYVLQGDIRLGDHTLRAGDYQRCETGTDHGVQSTEGGCLLLVIAAHEAE